MVIATESIALLVLVRSPLNLKSDRGSNFFISQLFFGHNDNRGVMISEFTNLLNFSDNESNKDK
jgi:hypothetical protein